MNNTVKRTIDILFFVSKQKQSSTITNISRELQIPKSTVFNIVHSLIELGMLQIHDEKRMTFGLGYNTFDLGQSYIKNNSLWEIVHKEIAALKNQIKRTISYMMCKGESLVLLDILPYDGSVYPNISVGDRWNLLDASTGLVCMSSMSDGEIASKYGSGSVDIVSLLADVHKVRKDGFCIGNKGQSSEDLSTVSVPLFNSEQRCVGAICFYELNSKLQTADVKDLVKTVQNTTARIAKQLGY